ncbi:MAG: GAF domain-containing protein [Blastocatellia bacterium]|nr:GAF domain-containing protein [Blastocatellia bacterium]
MKGETKPASVHKQWLAMGRPDWWNLPVRYFLLCGTLLGVGLVNLPWTTWAGQIQTAARQPVSNPTSLLEGRPTFRIFTDRDGLPQNTITSVVADRKGYLWVGTQDGVARYNGQRWAPVLLPTSNRSNYVYALLAAADGSLWVGTNGAGLAHLQHGVWTTFDRSSGLPGEQVRCLLETEESDRSHILWAGISGGGLAYWHNGTWTVFTKDNSPLPHNSVVSLMSDREVDGSQTLWVGTAGGLVRIQRIEEERKRASTGPRPPASSPQSPGNWTVFTKDNAGLPHNGIFCLLRSIEPDGSHTIWAGTGGGGLARFQTGQWTTWNTENSRLPHNIVRCLLETSDRSGRKTLWIGTYGGGVASWRDGQWAVFDRRLVGLPNDGVWSLTQTQTAIGASTLWIGTTSGLAQFNSSQWKTYTQAAGLPNNLVFSLLESSDPNRQSVWIGTGGGGLAHLASSPQSPVPGLQSTEAWTLYNTENSSLPGNRVLCLLPDRNQTQEALWVGTNGGGLAHIKTRAGNPPDGKTEVTWEVFTTKNSNLPNDLVWCLAQTVEPKTGRTLWIGTYGGGLVCLKEEGSGSPGSLESLGSLPNSEAENRRTAGGSQKPVQNSFLPSKPLKPLKPPKTFSGFTTFNSANSGLPTDRVFSLCVSQNLDGAPVLWIGTDGAGLVRFEQGRWTVFDSKNSQLPNNTVLSLFESTNSEGQRTLWVGTAGGVACLNPYQANPKWRILTTETSPALPNNTVNHICADWQKRVYLCTNRGIVRLAPLADGSDFRTTVFTTQDGLPSNECNQGASMIDRQGRIWVGTAEGAAIFDPADEIEDRTQKALLVERVLLNGKAASGLAVGGLHDTPPDLPQFGYWENNLVFEYALLSFFREADSRYQTQLVGFDPAPTEWTGKSAKEYTNLPDGTYRFRVWGRDYAGNVSGPVELAFAIRPAPWRTWWAYLLYAGILAGAGIGIFQWRLQTLQRRQQRRVEELRRRQEQRIENLRQLLESIRVINSELDLSTVLQRIAEESARLIEGRPAGIGLVEGAEVVFKRMWLNEQWIDQSITFPLGYGVAGTVATTGEGLILNDPETSPQVAFPELLKQHQVTGLIAVPVTTRKGKVVGVLAVFRRERPFTVSDQHLLEALAHQAAVAIENAALYGELEEKNLLVIESMKELEKLFEHEQHITRSLQELNQMKSNFMIVTSHEMRTPLTVLRGYTEAITSEMFGPLTNLQRSSLEACQRMVERMVNSVEGIQEMLSISAGTMTLKPVEFDLRDMLDDIVGELSEHARKRRLQIQCDLPDTIWISAHEEKIRLVFYNLLQNAVKFSYDGGEVRLRALCASGHVEVSVEDDGIGIETGEIERIFEKFYTTTDTSTHTSGQFEFSARGIGLGLSISRSYVEAHGGRIYAESAGKGQGSRFRVVLPSFAQVAAESLVVEQSAREADGH